MVDTEVKCAALPGATLGEPGSAAGRVARAEARYRSRAASTSSDSWCFVSSMSAWCAHAPFCMRRRVLHTVRQNSNGTKRYLIAARQAVSVPKDNARQVTSLFNLLLYPEGNKSPCTSFLNTLMCMGGMPCKAAPQLRSSRV